MTDTRPRTKTCALLSCGAEFTKRPNTSWAEFEKRQYCSQEHSTQGRARTAHNAVLASARRIPALPTSLRYVDGVWRPSAPGWPDVPNTRRCAP